MLTQGTKLGKQRGSQLEKSYWDQVIKPAKQAKMKREFERAKKIAKSIVKKQAFKYLKIK